MKNVNIMGVHQFLVEGGHKEIIYMGNCLKRGLGQFTGGLVKNREGVFEGVDTLDVMSCSYHCSDQFQFLPGH